MAGKCAGIETGLGGIRLDDIRDRSTGQPRGSHRARLVDRTEDRSGLNTRCAEPRLQGVCTENLIRVNDVMESPKLAE